MNNTLCPLCGQHNNSTGHTCWVAAPLNTVHPNAVITPVSEYEIIREWERRYKELKAENQRLREAIQAAIDCGMVPLSSAKDGGASKYGEHVRVADMLRAALLGGEG